MEKCIMLQLTLDCSSANCYGYRCLLELSITLYIVHTYIHTLCGSTNETI